jgi:hypothetical protein
MRKLILLAVAALLVPGLALAAGKPTNPGKSGAAHGAHNVMYVLRGTLTAYTAANGTTDGSVTIVVKSANHHGASLVNQTLTIPVSSATKIVGKFNPNDDGVVKARAPKNTAASALVTALQSAKAWQVIDQGTSTSGQEND